MGSNPTPSASRSRCLIAILAIHSRLLTSHASLELTRSVDAAQLTGSNPPVARRDSLSRFGDAFGVIEDEIVPVVGGDDDERVIPSGVLVDPET